MLDYLKELLENPEFAYVNGTKIYTVTEHDIREIIDIVELAMEVGNVEGD